MKYIKILLVMLALTVTGNTFSKSHFIIDMVKLKKKENSINYYLETLKSIAKTYNGTLMVNPITIEGQIKTDVAPTYTTDFDYDYIFIIRFDKKSDAKKYAKDSRTIKNYTDFSKLVENQTVFLSKNMMALPAIPKFPEIDNILIRSEPAFILVNAINMKMTPTSMIRMMKYFKRNYSSITKSGTNYFSTFKVAKVLKGDFDFKMLFLTEWASMEAFNEVHDSSNFKENVHLRNKSFKGFTEGKGRVYFNLKLKKL